MNALVVLVLIWTAPALAFLVSFIVMLLVEKRRERSSLKACERLWSGPTVRHPMERQPWSSGR